VGAGTVNVKEGAQFIAAVNPLYFMRLLEAHAKLGSDEVTLHIEKSDKPMKMVGSVGDTSLLQLSEFLENSLERSRRQVRENTLRKYASAMRHFIGVIGNIDYRQVKHQHGERFMQTCLDGGNAPATAKKKLTAVKRLFQLGVERGQLDENPLKYVRRPRVPEREIHTYTDEECTRFIEAAGDPLWNLMIRRALCTGMRRGELSD